MLWACIEKRRREYVGKRVMVIEVPGKEGKEHQIGCGWITSITTCRRVNYQERNYILRSCSKNEVALLTF